MRTNSTFAILFFTFSVQWQVAPVSQSPSAENYFHYAALEQYCRDGKDQPIEVVEVYRQHTIRHLETTAKLGNAASEVALKGAQQVRANVIPQEMQIKLSKSIASAKSATAKIACKNISSIIRTQIAIEELAILQNGIK